MFNRVDQLIDFEEFLQLRCTEMLLINNSNGKLEKNTSTAALTQTGRSSFAGPGVDRAGETIPTQSF